MRKEQPVIVGLDIGTTKIVAIAGQKNEFGKLEILGFGKADSSGVNHGMVLNIDDCIRSIEVAMGNCLANNPLLNIKEVYVGIAGHHIKSIQTRGDRVLTDIETEIRREDINALIKDQYKTYIPAGDEIIDIIPQDFTVDALAELTQQQVIGMSGIKIGANFHIITGDKTAIKNIHRCVHRSGLQTKDLVLQPLASAAAVMCAEDFEAGVAIVDIGGGTTDLAVFHDGMLKHTAVIPIAGVNITNDIRHGLGVLRSQAEQMKIQFGMALAEEAKTNAFITIPGLKGQMQKEISVKNLANIIQARMEEILEHVVYQLKQINLLEKLYGGIILTGGGSQLKHLIQLTEYRTGLSARIGFANEHVAAGHISELVKPMYATCIGLILRGYDDYEQNRIRFISSNSVDDTKQFVHTAQTYEPSIQEILEKEFGTNQSLHTESNLHDDVNINANEIEFAAPTISSTIEQNLFTPPPPIIEENQEVSTQNSKKRTKTIRNIYGTVKNQIMYWFENVDDERL